MFTGYIKLKLLSFQPSIAKNKKKITNTNINFTKIGGNPINKKECIHIEINYNCQKLKLFFLKQ